MHDIRFDKIIHNDQDLNVNKIEQIQSNAEFDELASMIMKMEWFANTKSDTVLKISQNI